MSDWKRIQRRKKDLWNCNHKCFYCDIETVYIEITPSHDLTGSNVATLDHFIPISKGGGSRLHNLVISCNDCNKKKADEMPNMDDVKKKLIFYGELLTNLRVKNITWPVKKKLNTE